ncbi:hypothetical protein [Crocinitomix algicola]|uniref:hypothetical protein n=1 Tax=Crocinitomix algicola TaxID=1740263 RepID=UPI000871FAAE|nr:hypothetical protein [Crocinitomix algicola]
MRFTYFYLPAFILGTFKFLFSHWTIHFTALQLDDRLNFFELFTPATMGALITMLFFYTASEKLMNRALLKRIEKIKKAQKSGKSIKPKKNFTRMNKLIVRTKRKLGLKGVVIIAPLFLSIPIGSIICAKFYRHHKKTLPLMMTVVITYSLLMSTIITLFA